MSLLEAHRRGTQPQTGVGASCLCPSLEPRQGQGRPWACAPELQPSSSSETACGSGRRCPPSLPPPFSLMEKSLRPDSAPESLEHHMQKPNHRVAWADQVQQLEPPKGRTPDTRACSQLASRLPCPLGPHFTEGGVIWVKIHVFWAFQTNSLLGDFFTLKPS